MRNVFRTSRPQRHPGAIVLLLLSLFAWTLPTALAEETGALSVQLNKLEADGDACRAYIVLENASDITFEGLRLDMVLFDVDGVIARRLAVDAAPLAAGKTSVRVFGISNLACDNIGRVLLNDILVCQDATGDRTDCMQHIVPDSIAGVPFIK
ncbi:MAG TPA: Tat pathway signal sequence domain protein [Thioalkalivibrio sp.]|nr:Tat pathway signal sequence domain protein [Thioalkalivibrio sp.]